MNYDLSRLGEALRASGSPQARLKAFLVGGTNGKGSVARLLSSVLTESDHSVGTFLSPHLESVTERFLAGMVPADEAELASLASELGHVGRLHNLSYFEFLTLMFCEWAARKRFDFCVVEVGLGGRLDSTNLIDPLASLITNVSLDHQEYLGNDRPAILQEKLGIVRNESLLFTGVTEPGLKEQVIRVSDALDTIYYFSDELKRVVRERRVDGQTITLNGFTFELTSPTPGAIDNAALAFLFFRIVFPVIPLEKIQAGFKKMKNPGRFEIVRESPRVIVSGDHNEAGVEDLVATVKSLPNLGRVKVLCGFSGDKPYEQLLSRLREVCTEPVVVPVAHARVPAPAEYRDLPGFHPDAKAALTKMLETAEASDTIIMTGSLYLVGELRALASGTRHDRGD